MSGQLLNIFWLLNIGERAFLLNDAVGYQPVEKGTQPPEISVDGDVGDSTLWPLPRGIVLPLGAFT